MTDQSVRSHDMIKTGWAISAASLLLLIPIAVTNSGWWVLVFAILALSGFGLMVAGTLTA